MNLTLPTFASTGTVDPSNSSSIILWLTSTNLSAMTSRNVVVSSGDMNKILNDISNDLFTYRQPFTIVLIVLYVLTFLAGFVGNVLVIAVVARHQHMRTLTNVFLVNLAFADLMVIVVCMPFTLARYVYQNWIYGSVMCKLTPFVQGLSVALSVLTLLAISLDRLLAIVKPMKARIIFSKRTVKFIIAVIWFVSVILFIPMLVVNVIDTQNVVLPGAKLRFVTCKEHWTDGKTSKQIYNLFMFIALFVLPLFIMTVAYVVVAILLWHGNDKGHLRSSEIQFSQPEKIIRGRQRVVKMLISLVILFAISWLPYHVINIYVDSVVDFRNLKATSRLVNYVFPLAQWFGFANSASNPACYCFMSRSFRGAFLSTFSSSCVTAVDRRSDGVLSRVTESSLRYASTNADERSRHQKTQCHRNWKRSSSLYARCNGYAERSGWTNAEETQTESQQLTPLTETCNDA